MRAAVGPLLALTPLLAAALPARAQEAYYEQTAADQRPLPAAYAQAVRTGDRFVTDGDFASAARSYGEAAVQAPRALLPRLLCAMALTAARRTREAVPVLRNAVRLEEGDLVTSLLLQGALSEVGDAAESQQIWLECVRRFGSNAGGLDASRSIRWLTDAARYFPTSAPVHLLLGDAYQVGQQWDEANREYRAAMANAPRWAKPRVNLGFALLAQGKTEEAIKALEEGVQQDPSNSRARLAIADAHLKARRNNEALQKYQGLLDKAPAPSVAVSANIGAGQASLNMGQVTSAETFFNNAQRLAPRDPTPVMAIGQLRVTQGRYSAAANSFSTALKLSEEGGIFAARPSLYRAIASAHLQARRPEEAVRVLDEALVREPAEAALWHRLAADAAMLRGDTAGVEAALRRALDAEVSLYPQATLKAIEDRGLIVKLIAAYQSDLQGACTGVSPSGNRNSGVVLRSVKPSKEAEVTALAALGHLFRFVGNTSDEVSVRIDLCHIRNAGSDWFLLAEAYERSGRSTDARVAYHEALQRGNLPPSALAVCKKKLL